MFMIIQTLSKHLKTFTLPWAVWLLPCCFSRGAGRPQPLWAAKAASAEQACGALERVRGWAGLPGIARGSGETLVSRWDGRVGGAASRGGWDCGKGTGK